MDDTQERRPHLPFPHPSFSPGWSWARRTSAIQTRQALVRRLFEDGFPYVHEVRGHRSCVNALAFSRGTGQWLASGGDDMRIHVRDVLDYDVDRSAHPEASTYRTYEKLLGPTSNIFSLSWSAGNTRLYSGGNDHNVFSYDMHYDDRPIAMSRAHATRRHADGVVTAHQAGIREVSAHPTNPHLVLSSSDSGELFLLDMRLPDDHVAGYSYFPAQLASAQWNPNECDGHTLALATVCEPMAGVALFDTRMLFSEQRLYTDLGNAIIRYASSLCIKRPPDGMAMRRMETTGAQFDPSGRFLMADVSLYHPVLYAVGNAEPLATLSSVQLHPHRDPCRDGAELPIFDRYVGYRNSCTVKRGSFGFESQSGSLYYVTGSDDFRAYGWRIPTVDVMVERRERMAYRDWLAHPTHGTHHVWFRGDPSRTAGDMVHPYEMDTPSFTLEGTLAYSPRFALHREQRAVPPSTSSF